MKAIALRLAALARELKNVSEELEAGAVDYVPDFAKEYIAARICLWCREVITEDERVVRGAHESCCKLALKEVKSGKTTEAELITTGRLGPKGTGGEAASQAANIE